MLQHWAHSRNRPTATDKKKVFSILVAISLHGWYNFGKIVKTVATGCHILKLKCTKFDFGRGSAPDPAGDLTALREREREFICQVYIA